ncbi:hypothetical protein NLG97_g1511 [Lecanicillium saksenae]|uniref:Uncharacterized protein n=1 Tax=Lecanicillium saksenae TaxID=468837 RepID=A0ACC1R3I8_9HYPO|nr:hypothetical protein NLG97_g1511 [Lecanicillium saksenae]
MSRRQRSKVNKDRRAGLSNRQWGMCTKANAFAQLYNVDIIVAIRRPDGGIGGYQSRAGLAHELLLGAEHNLLGPSEVDSYLNKETSSRLEDSNDRELQSISLKPQSPHKYLRSASSRSSSSNGEMSSYYSAPEYPNVSKHSESVSVPSPTSLSSFVESDMADTQPWDGDLALSPAILCPQPINSSGRNLPDQDSTPFHQTIDPKALDYSMANASAVLHQPTPVSAGQRKAILTLLNSYL